MNSTLRRQKSLKRTRTMVAAMSAALRAAMPVLGACAGIGTISLTYTLTRISGHLPDGVTTPPISLLGCQSPEREAYQVGFALTGLLLLLCIRTWARDF